MEDGKNVGGSADARIRELGEAGWELAQITPRSGSGNYPGLTTEELWVFKRAR